MPRASSLDGFRVVCVGISQETAIGVGVTAVALVAMAFDHLVGPDPGLEDPIAFVISAALTLAVAFVLFGVLIPRTKRGSAPVERAATRGGILVVVAFLSISLIWLGVTFPIAGAALALGLMGRNASRRWPALAAIVVGSIVLILAAVFSDWTSSS
jgi:hypothetical protein